MGEKFSLKLFNANKMAPTCKSEKQLVIAVMMRRNVTCVINVGTVPLLIWSKVK